MGCRSSPSRTATNTLNDSFRLGSVFGITIRVHVLFLIMMGVIVLFSPTPIRSLVILTLLFSLVFLHELGHSLMAQYFGIRVVDITFWPLGGMARMSEIPENPKIEGLIAIAGPAVNFALAGLGCVVMLLVGGFDQIMSANVLRATGSPLAIFIWVNLLLGGFNLIPAFPMDGGRVLRAMLGRTRNWVTATEQAVRVGRYAALLMAISGLYFGHCEMVLIAGFVWWIGMRELMGVRLRHGLPPFMPAGFSSNGPGGMGGDANWPDRKASMFDGPPDSFSNMLQALMRRSQGHSLEDDLERQYQQTTRGEDEPVNPNAPTSTRSQEDVDLDAKSGGGFTDTDIEKLENFKGRLRRPPSE
ncbi:MAG: Zn-dependent protease [Planctomycetota bacterium]